MYLHFVSNIFSRSSFFLLHLDIKYSYKKNTSNLTIQPQIRLLGSRFIFDILDELIESLGIERDFYVYLVSSLFNDRKHYLHV